MSKLLSLRFLNYPQVAEHWVGDSGYFKTGNRKTRSIVVIYTRILLIYSPYSL